MTNRPRAKTAFLIRHVSLPLLVWVSGALLFELTDLDLAASKPFYRAASRRWIGHGTWWANELLHTGGKWLVVLVGASALAAFALSFRVPRLSAWRGAALYLALSIGTATGLVAAVKQVTDRHCPREMKCFGGPIPYSRLFDGTPPGYPPGRCFPAGHASGAMSLLALYFIARSRGAGRPWIFLLPSLVLGAGFAAAQQARGAHFLSHNLWTSGICWFAALGLAAAFGARLEGAQNACELENETSQPRRPRGSALTA